MAHQSFEAHARSAGSPQQVWEMLANIPGWSSWAGPLVRRSARERDGAPEPDGVGAIRKLGSPPVFSREEIVEFEPPSHMAYVIRSDWPVRGYRAEVDLQPEPGGGTTIRWRGTLQPAIPGTGPALRSALSLIVRDLARRLAAAAQP